METFCQFAQAWWALEAAEYARTSPRPEKLSQQVTRVDSEACKSAHKITSTCQAHPQRGRCQRTRKTTSTEGEVGCSQLYPQDLSVPRMHHQRRDSAGGPRSMGMCPYKGLRFFSWGPGWLSEEDHQDAQRRPCPALSASCIQYGHLLPHLLLPSPSSVTELRVQDRAE